MTLITELASEAGRVEFFLSIEGVGYPVTYVDLSQGFNGAIFSTADLDGDLQTKLQGSAGDATLYKGLSFRLGASSYSTRSGAFGPGSATFEVVDGADWFDENFFPCADPTDGITIQSDLAYEHTTVYLAEDSATSSFSAGDVVWVNGVEAIKLGTWSYLGGVIHQFTGCTRGMLGTPRGDISRSTSQSAGFRWTAGTRVLDVHQIWYNRIVQLYAHVPGEAIENSLRVFSGTLRDMKHHPTAVSVIMECVGSPIIAPSQKMWKAMKYHANPSRIIGGRTSQRGNYDNGYQRPESGMKQSVYMSHIKETGYEDGSSLCFAYRYRNHVTGGTSGARNVWNADDTGVQAMATAQDGQTVMRFLKLGDRIYLCEKGNIPAGDITETPAGSGTLELYDRHKFQLEAWSSVGQNGESDVSGMTIDLLPRSDAQFLLENWFEDYRFNDYSRNKQWSRNIVDVFLHHLMTRDDEYVVADCNGGTATTITFGSTIAPSANFWSGACLYCTEGANKSLSRTIASNTTTAITLEDDFPSAPTSGDEYQIRNTAYDTLPYGWGLGVPWYNVDIDSFETVRDKYLSDADCDRFTIGVTNKMDLWKLLEENILMPYGIAVTISATTGKVTARYISQPIGDGVDSDYRQITDSDVIDVGDYAYDMRPIGAVHLAVRSSDEKVTGFNAGAIKRQGNLEQSTNANFSIYREQIPIQEQVPSSIGADSFVTYVQASDVFGFNETELDTVEWKAEFDSIYTMHNLETRVVALISDFSKPRPHVTMRLSYEFIDLEIGDIVKLSSITNLANPFNPNRTWATLVARVVGVQVEWIEGNPGVSVSLEMLQDFAGGRIAPAALVTSKGTAGYGDYYVVSPTAYTADAANDKDYYGFAVGDEIELRAKDGSVKSSDTIESFGANEATDPADASTDVINIAGTASAVAAGDYITFDSWWASLPDRQKNYAGLAIPSTELMIGGEAPKRYG